MTSLESAAADQLGNFDLVRKIGAGGMGRVFEARNTETGELVAIKLLHAELREHPRALRRFKREARTSIGLVSDHIIKVHEFRLAPQPHLIMELLTGTDLRKLLRQHGPLDMFRAVGFVIDACKGLAVAHAAGLIHRDLKPENLFVIVRADGSELVKVLDFGVAKLRHAGSSTSEGSLVGTLRYMAPEQIRNVSDCDARLDVYAMGAILYECLTGRAPFLSEEPHTLLFNILNDQPPAPRSLRPSIPAALEKVILRALASAPERRFRSVAEFVDHLLPFSSGNSWDVVPELTRGPAEADEDDSVVTGEQTAASSAWLRKPRLAALILAAVALVGAVGLRFSRETRAAEAATNALLPGRGIATEKAGPIPMRAPTEPPKIVEEAVRPQAKLEPAQLPQSAQSSAKASERRLIRAKGDKVKAEASVYTVPQFSGDNPYAGSAGGAQEAASNGTP